MLTTEDWLQFKTPEDKPVLIDPTKICAIYTAHWSDYTVIVVGIYPMYVTEPIGEVAAAYDAWATEMNKGQEG